MKLTFHRTVPSELHKFYQLSFDKLCGRLGITDFKLNVRLEFATHIPGPELVALPGDRSTAGATGPDDTDDNIKRAKAGLQLRDLVLTLDPAMDFSRMLAALCHEMVHVKQIAFGELRAVLTRQNGEWKAQSAYYSVPVDMAKTPYEDLPWEKEPHARMWSLAAWLAKELEKTKEGWVRP